MLFKGKKPYFSQLFFLGGGEASFAFQIWVPMQLKKLILQGITVHTGGVFFGKQSVRLVLKWSKPFRTGTVLKLSLFSG